MASGNPYQASETGEGRNLDYDARLSVCPRCGLETEEGFAFSGIQYTSKANVLRFVNFTESLPGASWWSRLTELRATYLRAHLCRACGCYLIDGSTTLSYNEARRLAAAAE